MGIDKFYTLPAVAQECINLIPDLSSYDLIIEPSAGNGSFSCLIDCVAYDIEPEHPDIIQQDFFTVKKQKANHLLILGNPPFGPRSSLAKQFIKHSREIGAETIAFVLPDTFSKLSNQSKTLFPADWHLIVEYKLSDSSFIKEDGSLYYVPCSFYVWTKRESDVDLRKQKLPPSEDFVFLPRGDSSADFCVNGNSGKIKSVADVTNQKAEHYIKAKKKDAQQLRKDFENLNFSFYSSVNGNNAWIGQQEILQAYYNMNK